ncbi:MAG: C10 family peptidase [candidate division Zixibacteria bacterium]|nr:C10 family peptidase [candidate division Zixibacteria bacterium]
MRLLPVLVLVLICLITAQAPHAELASKTESDRVCANWLTQVVHDLDSWAGSDQPQIENTWELKAGNQLLARCYDISPNGFVVVPELKALPPIKAYSGESRLDDSQRDGFLAFLTESLEEKVRLFELLHGSLDAHSGTAKSVESEWQRLTLPPEEFAVVLAQKDRSETQQAGPLLTSSWHQRGPYNDLCPMGQGSRCVVGCVATATAQIINYWQWPDSGIGSHSYDWSGDRCDPGYNAQTLSADFSDPYDWDNMIDSCDEGCSSASEAALAELNYEVGVAFNMSYGSCGSGASTARALEVFPQFFKYSHNIEKADRDTIDLAGWFDIMRAEIDAGRVGQYRIRSHSIVMDGYREIGGQYQYHMNYGWGNGFNAWYTLDSLYCYWVLPDSVCPANEEFIVTNIEPETEPYLRYYMCAIAEIGGDGDGHADADEDISLTITIGNDGAPTSGITGNLTSLDPYVSVVSGTTDYDDNVAWTQQTTGLTPFVVHVDPSCPDPHVALLEHLVTCDGGSMDRDTIQLFVGDTEGFTDQMEAGQGDWRHYPTSEAYYDEWHMETFKYNSESTSWKVGGLGADVHTDNLNAALVTPPLLLPLNARLTFWHWIDAEIESASTAYDGATVWIGTSDGQWTQLIPDGGYTHTFVSSSLPPGAGCFSGTFDWRQEEVTLSSYSGVAQIMFLFYSDGAVHQEGWYVDDVEITYGGCCDNDGKRGNVDAIIGEGEYINVADLTYLVSYLFTGGHEPPCMDEGNVDGLDNSGSLINIADLTYLVAYLFTGGPTPPTCP